MQWTSGRPGDQNKMILKGSMGVSLSGCFIFCLFIEIFFYLINFGNLFLFFNEKI